MTLRYIKLWHYLGAIQVITLIYLMWTSVPVNVEVSHIDKLVHWLLFVILMSWYIQITRQGHGRSLSIIFITLLGIGLEYMQALSPYRHFDYFDMLANLLGIVSGIGLMKFARLHYLYHIERLINKEKGE